MSTVPPTSDFLTAHAAILVFLGAIVGILVITLLLWKVLRPSRFSEEKLTIYECGEDPTGSAWIQFSVAYYLFALIFLAFDVDVLFLFPAILAYDSPGIGFRDFGEIFVFVGILLLAIVFAWRKGAFSWK